MDEKTIFASTNPKESNKIAPINGANQNVCIWNLPIFKTGKANTQIIIPTIAITEITSAAITIRKYTLNRSNC